MKYSSLCHIYFKAESGLYSIRVCSFILHRNPSYSCITVERINVLHAYNLFVFKIKRVSPQVPRGAVICFFSSSTAPCSSRSLSSSGWQVVKSQTQQFLMFSFTELVFCTLICAHGIVSKQMEYKHNGSITEKNQEASASMQNNITPLIYY